MVLSQLFNGLLLRRVIPCTDDIVHPPFVAACRAEHTAHQMIAAVRMGKGVKRIVFVHTEIPGGDEDGAAGAQGNIAHAVSHSAGAHRRRRVVACARRHLHRVGNSQLVGDFGQHAAHGLITLVAVCQLLLGDAADLAHLFGPSAVLHVEEQHTGGIGHIRAMYPGEFVGDIVFGQHDLGDSGKVLRLLVFHPENLGSGKAGKGDVGRVLRQLFLADHIVQIIAFLICTPIVPQKRGTDHLIVLIQNHQPVHLAAKTDARHLALIRILQQFLNAQHGLLVPVLGLLLRPARIGEINGIFPGDDIPDFTLAVHQQQLYRRCA